MAEDFEIGGPPPEESTNRTFVLAAAGIGGLLVLSMVCLALYALVLAPRQRQARADQATQIALNNTQVAQAVTQTAGAQFPSATSPATRTATGTPTRTQTPVVVVPTATATVTPGAPSTISVTTFTPTVTALPTTGFADEAGFPMLIVLAGVLILVAIVARRMRLGTAA